MIGPARVLVLAALLALAPAAAPPQTSAAPAASLPPGSPQLTPAPDGSASPDEPRSREPEPGLLLEDGELSDQDVDALLGAYAPGRPAVRAALRAWQALREESGRDKGLHLLYHARQLAGAGESELAFGFLDAARIELPGHPWVAHAMADLHAEREAWDAARAEYLRGARDGFQFRAFFNRGVVGEARAEQLLRDELVAALGESWRELGLEPATLPDGPQPELLQVLEDAIPRFEQARLDFLQALAERQDADARASVAALNARLDELRALRDALRERQQEQPSPEGRQGEPPPDDEPQDEQPQDGSGQQGEEPQDPGDQQQDPAGQEGQQGQQPEAPPPGEDDAQGQQPPVPEGGLEPSNLTPQQRQALLDRLEQLEEVALELRRRQRQNERQGVEKDW